MFLDVCPTDRISKKEVSVSWCPTEDMTGDFWTKPLQGAGFAGGHAEQRGDRGLQRKAHRGEVPGGAVRRVFA